MPSRLTSPERKQQIIEATMLLLASHPVHRVTTRMIADAIGLSQPALFRHLPSRDAIFEAVVAASRETLHDNAVDVFERGEDWAGTARGLADVLLDYVDAHPGLPRLFFHAMSTNTETSAGSLSELVRMQAALVTSLVQEGQSRGDIPATVDPYAAGQLFVVVIQGSIMLSKTQPTSTLRSAIELWIAGVRAGCPISMGSPNPINSTEGQELIVELDVRPLVAQGSEPLQSILDAIRTLAPTGVLLLTAPFRPAPLLRLLNRKGFRSTVASVNAEQWEITVLRNECSPVLDVRELPQPEPMEAILFATAALEAGAALVARVPRVPRLLFPRLHERHLHWVLCERPDGTALIHITKP